MICRRRLADNTEHLAAGNVERNIVHGEQGAVPTGKLHAQVADAEDRIAHRSFGLSASRSQSPMR